MVTTGFSVRGGGFVCVCVFVCYNASGKCVTSRTEVRGYDLPPLHLYLGQEGAGKMDSNTHTSVIHIHVY